MAQATDAQAAQTGLSVLMARDVDQAWHLLNPTDLESTLPKFKLAIAALVRRYGHASGALGAEFYREMRREAGVTAKFTMRIADPAGVEQVDKAIGWATRGLWTPTANVEGAKTMAVGAAQKMVLDVGRQTVVDTVHTDRKAIGWARVTQPGCCAFCALLATRGAVYKTETTADFKAHDHDKCYAEPVFTAYEPSAQIREWQALYRDKVRGASDPLKTWRQVFADHNNPSGTANPTPQEGQR